MKELPLPYTPTGSGRGLIRTTSSLSLLIAAVFLLPMGLSFEIATSLTIRRQFSPFSSDTFTSLGATDQNRDGKVDDIGTVTILVPRVGGDVAVSKFVYQPSTETPLSFTDAADKVSVKVREMTNDVIAVSVCAVPASSSSSEEIDSVRKVAAEADVLIGLGLASPFDVRFLSTLFRERRVADGVDGEPSRRRAGKRCQFALDCDKPFAPIVGPHDEANPSLFVKIPWSGEASGRQLMYQMMVLFQRWTVDDFAEALLIFFRRFSDKPIPTFDLSSAKDACD